MQGWDRYAYVNNAPTRFTDPSGHRCVPEDECDTSHGDTQNNLFRRLPVDTNNIIWTQPYGNTEIAWRMASNNGYNYCGYAQCLHAGIDLGAPAGTPVYAGIYGNWLHSCNGNNCNYDPGWVTITSTEGDVVLYGHIIPVDKIDNLIAPDTIIGYIANQGSNSHTHIEVSKNGNYYNPALLMIPEAQMQYLSHIDKNAFHQIPDFPGLWTNPLGQPTIRHGGIPVWVALGICESKGYGNVTIGGVEYKDRYLGVQC